MKNIKVPGHSDFIMYNNTVMFSLESPKEGSADNGDLRQDCLVDGDPRTLAAGLCEMMKRHNVFAAIITSAVGLYDHALIATQQLKK